MFGRVLLTTAVISVATFAGTGAGGAPSSAAAMTRVAQDPACVAACQATFDAEEARCRAIDLSGGFRGGFYRPCVSYAQYQYNACVAACPA